MKKRQELIFIIGADGSGKDKLAEMLAKENNAVVVRLTNYEGSRLFTWLGKGADRFVRRGDKRNSKKLTVVGYGLHSILFGPYSFMMRQKALKEGRPIIFNRYPPFDIQAMAGIYGKDRADKLIKEGVKTLSAYKRPAKGDRLYVLEVDPKEAMRRINARTKPKQRHETEENIEKMNRVFLSEASKAKKAGLKVIRKRM